MADKIRRDAWRGGAGLVLLLAAWPARAEKFLGEELPGAAASRGRAALAPATRAPEARSEASASRGADEGEANPLAMSASLGASAHVATGQGALIYPLGRFFGVGAAYAYTRADYGDTKGEQYGPELDLALRVPTPTAVTLVAGAGPGHVKWQRWYQGETYDAGQAATAHGTGGLDLRLTPRFGLQVLRKRTWYFAAPPRKFAQRDERESRERFETTAGFRWAL